MTLGCGGFGGNITSDNISPRHLLNIKRLAYETRPARPSGDRARPDVVSIQDSSLAAAGTSTRPAEARPQAAVEFVCEADVRRAIEAGTRIVINERTIVTPSARDLADEHKIFLSSSWSKT
jgi:hypothetical protein